MLEKFLTVSQEGFQRYLVDAPELKEEEIDKRREAYRYSKVAYTIFYAQIVIDTASPSLNASLCVRNWTVSINVYRAQGYLILKLVPHFPSALI